MKILIAVCIGILGMISFWLLPCRRANKRFFIWYTARASDAKISLLEDLLREKTTKIQGSTVFIFVRHTARTDDSFSSYYIYFAAELSAYCRELQGKLAKLSNASSTHTDEEFEVLWSIQLPSFKVLRLDDRRSWIIHICIRCRHFIDYRLLPYYISIQTLTRSCQLLRAQNQEMQQQLDGEHWVYFYRSAHRHHIFLHDVSF